MDAVGRVVPALPVSLVSTAILEAGDQSLKAAPIYAPRRRLDETLAARKPVLTYKEPQAAEAAE